MNHEPRIDLGMLDAFLSQNKAIDFRKGDLRDASVVDTLKWAGFEHEKQNLIKQLKIYQRLLWILPNDRRDLVKKLLENGISSPVQIANESKEGFIQNHLKLFDGDSALAEQVYTRATTLMSKATSLQQSRVQQPSEPFIDATHIDLGKLGAFLGKNKEIDFRTADLLHAPNLDHYNWAGLEDEKESLIPQLKAYQRMLRVVPPHREDLAQKLLKNGIQSSLQIASTPKKSFIQDNLQLFDNDDAIATQVYLRAVALRKAVALQYVSQVQQSEPHIRTTGFVR
jgi:hypothetical protein